MFDALADAEISALVTKCDKHNAEAIMSASAGWRRGHLNALAAGEVEAAPVSAKPGLSYASAGRVRKPTR